jgi:hypothetical protein
VSLWEHPATLIAAAALVISLFREVHNAMMAKRDEKRDDLKEARDYAGALQARNEKAEHDLEDCERREGDRLRENTRLRQMLTVAAPIAKGSEDPQDRPEG